jgi:hypothetical protein
VQAQAGQGSDESHPDGTDTDPLEPSWFDF